MFTYRTSWATIIYDQLLDVTEDEMPNSFSLIAAVSGCILVIIFALTNNRPEQSNGATRLAGVNETVDVKFVTERNPYMRSER